MRYARQIIAGVLWLVLLVGIWCLARAQDSSILQMLFSWVDTAVTSPWGAWIMLGLFVIRPIFFLPSTILAFALGFMYGPGWGTLLGVIGGLLSATIAYSIGRFLTQGDVLSTNPLYKGRFGPLLHRMQTHTFETILLSRLLLMPGDAVNYTSGGLKLHYSGFALGTALGGLPGLVVVILLGASLEGEFNAGDMRLRRDYLLLSVVIALSSAGIYFGLRGRNIFKGSVK